jgi:hypothetical protein
MVPVVGDEGSSSVCSKGPSQLAAPFVSTPPSELTAAWPSISPQERNADGAFTLSLWWGGGRQRQAILESERPNF